MFDYLVPTLAPILAEIRDDVIPASQITRMESETLTINGVSTPFSWNDFFYNISLEGLHNTEAFKNKIKNISLKYELYKHYRDEGKQFDKSCNN